MKNLFKSFMIILSILILSIFNSCKKDDLTNPPVENEHPPATTVIMRLIKSNISGQASSDTLKVTVRDTTVIKGKPFLDGAFNLISGQLYKGSFILLDESTSPITDLTEDIIKEKDGHIFIFNLKSGANGRIIIDDLDKDNKGKNFGLNFRLSVTGNGTASGFINVLLRHYDSLNKDDSSYDTDLNRDFPINIQ
jgi:hypothetical protein